MRHATYKGRTYRLDYLGKTKHGERAKLSFLDGSKTFWVDASLVTECDAPSSGGGRDNFGAKKGWGTCPGCDERRRLVAERRDMSGLSAYVCSACACDDHLSFA